MGDQTLILADVAEKALIQLRESARELLTRSQSPVRRQTSVEYIPTRRHAEPPTSPGGPG